MSDIRRENEIEEYRKLLLIKGELNCEQIVTIDLFLHDKHSDLYITIKGNGKKKRRKYYTKLHHNEFLLLFPSTGLNFSVTRSVTLVNRLR